MSLMLKDENDSPSTNRTIFFYGAIICLVKLALSKVNLGVVQVPDFGGSEFAISIAALGGIYSLDKHVKNLKKSK